MTFDLSKYVKYKEIENFTIYLERNPTSERVRQMIVKYKKNNRLVQCCANDALFKLLFEPEKFKAEYMNKQNQRSK